MQCGSKSGGNGQLDGQAGAPFGADCANPDVQPKVTDFDAREQRAAGRFIQVADAAAAAAYSARWACQPRPERIVSGALSAASGAVRAASTALQRATQAMPPRMVHAAAQVLQAAHGVLNCAKTRLPATLRERVTACVHAVAAVLHDEAGDSDSRPDEWWRRDRNWRPSLWSSAGWRRLAVDVRSALPSLQTIMLMLSRTVPGFADVVLLHQRHEPLCVRQPTGAVDGTDAAH